MNDKLVWNLSDIGQYNILKRLHEKMSRANYYLECSGRPTTIINMDSYEATVICWALQKYSEEIEKRIGESK